MQKILIVDDDRLSRFALKDLLERKQYEVTEASSGAAALESYEPGNHLAVITDLKMPGMNGIELLEELKARDKDSAVILITAYGTIETAVEAMKKGASDYVTKPFEGEEILVRLSRIEEMRHLREENRRLREQVKPSSGLHCLVGRSKAMEKVFSLIETVASSQATILIEGASGSGKEMAATAIHALSTRAEGPFVPISCAALPETLLESELFGHEKHAFTGALRDKPGRFEMAHGGTLFLDDVDDVPLSVQVKLLRAIQERKIERLGATRATEIDVRILVAAKGSLKQRVESGEFREDLYYRLAVIPLRLPALSERREDIPLLAQHFMEKYCLRENRPMVQLTPETIDALEAYPWPGNVRELENVIERLAILCRGNCCGVQFLKKEITEAFDDKRAGPLLPALPDTGVNLVDELKQAERHMIELALKRCKGNKSRAAELLRLKRSTLGDRIAKLGISAADPDPELE